MGFCQIPFKSAYFKIFQQRFRVQVGLVGKLGVTVDGGTHMGIVRGLHIAVTFTGRAHQGTESVEADVFIHVQILQAVHPSFQFRYGKGMGAGSHKSAIDEGVR